MFLSNVIAYVFSVVQKTDVTSAGARNYVGFFFELVRLVRVELTTCRLGGGRSIHLSYNRNKLILADIRRLRNDLTEQSTV